MKRRHEHAATERVRASPQPGDAVGRAEQRPGGEIAEGDDDTRIDGLDLAVEEVPAGGDLFRMWVAIVRRPAFHDVRDVALGASQSNFLFDQSIKQLAGTPDERLALEVFISPRSLADEHQSRARRPGGENDVRASVGEWARDTGLRGSLELRERDHPSIVTP